MNSTPPILVGLTSYNDAPLLARTLPPLQNIARRFGMTVVVVNNGLNDDVSALLARDFPEFHELKPEQNLGFGAAYNRVIHDFPNFPIFWLMTNDVFVNEVGLEEVLKRFLEDESCVAAAGKFHAWNLKTDERGDTIDTLGIRAERRHYFYDWAQGEKDLGQYDDRLGEVFGLSGASFLIRLDRLPPLFSESIFMYKEDIDLAYRLRWLGANVRVFPVVWAWHARGAANRGDRSVSALLQIDRLKSAWVRRLSYANHFRILKRHGSWGFGMRVWLAVLVYECMKAGYMLFRDPKTLILGLRTLLFERLEPSNKRVSPELILKHFD